MLAHWIGKSWGLTHELKGTIMQAKIALTTKDFEAWFATLDEGAKVEFASSVKAELVKTHIAKLVGQEQFEAITDRVQLAVEQKAIDEFGILTRRYGSPDGFIPSKKFEPTYNKLVDTVGADIAKVLNAKLQEDIYQHYADLKTKHTNYVDEYFANLAQAANLDARISHMVDARVDAKLKAMLGQ